MGILKISSRVLKLLENAAPGHVEFMMRRPSTAGIEEPTVPFAPSRSSLYALQTG